MNRADGVANVTGQAQYAEAEMKNAKPLEHNKFKAELGTRPIIRASANGDERQRGLIKR